MAFVACSDDPTAPKIESTTFAPALGVNLSLMTKTASGLYYRDLTVGTGAVVNLGQQVVVYYTGWLPNGTQFDSRQPNAAPFDFRIGRGDVILGWEEGLVGAKAGGRRQLVVPPGLGYGDRVVGTIPKNSILVFVIDVVSTL
jgi:peptidylprolyl isomerase